MRGGDTGGLRVYNERLVIGAVRHSGALSKAEIGRETGLSGQAAAVIVDRLITDGFLLKLEKIRGQVGQPSTPIALDPDGAYALGVKIGRRSTEAILVNMLGKIVEARSAPHAAPLPEPSIATVISQIGELLASLGEPRRERLIGLGVAMPGELYLWARELGLEDGALDGWREIDVTARIAAATGLSVSLYNDATAACAAEMIAGDGIVVRSALYIYLGSFIGGGVVLDGRLYRGDRLNAGAIGSMPTITADTEGRPEQLIHGASVIFLEQALDAAGLDPLAVMSGEPDERATPVFETWMETTIPALARAVVSALSVIDFEAVVVDGLLPPRWRRRFVGRLTEGLGGFNRAGLTEPEIATGSIGPMARVLGAALLPLEERFSPDPELVTGSRVETGADALRAGR